MEEMKDKVAIALYKDLVNNDKQIAYGIVYAPGIADAHGDAMTADEIEQLAYSFMKKNNLTDRIDSNHDGRSTGSYMVESWIVKAGDPMFPNPRYIGAWALGIKVPNIELWKDIKSGKYAGYSFEAMARKNFRLVELEVVSEVYGETEPAEDGHTHFFVAVLDDNGRVQGGVTSEDEFHSHQIYSGTATEKTDGHSHRFFIDS
jgi:hypothetical protein